MEKELGHPMPGSADSCGYLDRAWLPKEELPVETGSDHSELFFNFRFKTLRSF